MSRQLLHHRVGLVAGLCLVLSVTPALAQVVINEVDYITMNSQEFIELKNTGGSEVNMGNYTIEFIDGSSGGVYWILPLPISNLAAGDYYVICALPDVYCDYVTGGVDIEDGAPDALVLKLNGAVVDAVSYDGDTPGATEGSGVGLEDPGDLSGISRFPDGTDTNQNNVDLSPRCITPGAANTAQRCDQPVAVAKSTWTAGKVLYR